MAELTLVWDVFEYAFEADRRRIGKIKPIRTYRNPVILAREWVEAMEAGGFPSRRAFAKAVGVSHSRMSQMLGLLELAPGVLRRLEALGDPLHSREVTERKLRPLALLPLGGQQAKIEKILTSRR